MLFVVFKAGGSRYALEARHVLEVTPRVALRPCPGAPAWVAGLCNYRGAAVPVLDLGRLLGGAPCAPRLSTRLVLTPYRGRSGRERVVGLLAEGVTETATMAETDFNQAGVATAQTPFLGTLAAEQGEFIQRLDSEHLLPTELDAVLFAEEGTPA
jgi:chemotaxis-related protein WspB